MPDLTIDNVNKIIHDVRQQEITFSSLADELIDHICCDVENEMDKGLDFFTAYRRVIHKIGKRRLQEIQEETLYAVDSRYRQMKNTMKISGIAGTIMLGFATLFKIMHWPGAGIMMTLGTLMLAFIFMPTALGVLWKETHNTKKIFLFLSAFLAGIFFLLGILFKVQHWSGAAILLLLSAVISVLFLIPSILVSLLRDPENKTKRPVYAIGAASLILYLTGFTFKIMHWPGAGLLLLGGMFLLFIIVFPWYTLISWKEEKSIKPEFIFMTVGSLAIILPSALISLNLQRSYDQGYFINLNQQNALFNYLYENNKSLIEKNNDSTCFPEMEQVHSKTANLITLINMIESKMVGESEGGPGAPVLNPKQIKPAENGQIIDYNMLSNPFHPAPVNDFLFPGTVTRSELENAVADFKEYLSGLIPDTEFRNFEKILDPSACMPVTTSGKRKISVLSGLHSLLLLKNNLLTTEFLALQSIAKQN
jgi:hypothetical protein